MKKLNLTRRQFVRTMSVGAGGVLLAGPSLAVPSKSRLPQALDFVTLGNSNLKTTYLGIGTGVSATNRSSNITRSGMAERVVREAYDRGVRFFDCADAYGTHNATGIALKGIPRDNFILTTKIWVSPKGGIPEAERPDADVVVDRFRKELNMDYLDLVQIHLMTDPKWTDVYKKQMDILENLKAKGIIRAHGVSVHSLGAMEACVGNPWIDVIHVRVNPYGASMDKPDPAEVTPVIKKLHDEGKGVIGMKLIGAGSYKNDSEKIDNTIKYVQGLGSIDMVIIGFETPEQIDNYITRIENSAKA